MRLYSSTESLPHTSLRSCVFARRSAHKTLRAPHLAPTGIFGSSPSLLGYRVERAKSDLARGSKTRLINMPLPGLSQQNPIRGIRRQQVSHHETKRQSDTCTNMQELDISEPCRKQIDGRDLLYKEDRASGHKVEGDRPEPCLRVLWPRQESQVAFKLHPNGISRQPDFGAVPGVIDN